MSTIASNLQQLRARIFAACTAAGRSPDSVLLLAVSKTFGAGAVGEAMAAGQYAFGENYLQEAVTKMGEVGSLKVAAPANKLQWHCIGPIQSNKSRLVAEHFDWAHTVDRLKIAQRLSEQRPTHLAPLQVCIQINIDGAASKSGVMPDDALALVRDVAQLQRLVVRGVMTIPEAAPDFEAQKRLHTSAKTIFDEIKQAGLPGLAHFDTLSMGMSADLEAAIHAGSTMVRVGSAIFGSRAVLPA